MIFYRPILLVLVAVMFASTSARATMTEAEVALGAHDYVAARALLMDEADNGDADAQYRLGVLFDLIGINRRRCCARIMHLADLD